MPSTAALSPSLRLMVATGLLLSAVPGLHARQWAPELAAVSLAAGLDGALWRLGVVDKRLVLGRSADGGRRFDEVAVVTAAEEGVNTAPETRPRLSVTPTGVLHVTYERRKTALYAADVILRTSTDGGRTFGPAHIVNDNHEEIGHSFHTSAVNARGDLFVVWLDDRGGNHIPEAGNRPRARGLYYAVRAADRPEAPLTNHRIREHSVCDCCRPALAFAPDGDAWLFLRLADDNIRDHGLFRLGAAGNVTAVGLGPRDHWAIEACPHHGPGLAASGDRLHAVWFTGAEDRPGLHYASSADGGKTYGAPRAVGRVDRGAGHADVLADGADVWLAWTERAEGVREAWVQHSGDHGTTWGPPRRVASAAAGLADYAFLHRVGTRVVLTWAVEGRLHVVDVGAALAAAPR